jgi:hypothetical protein
MIIRLIFIFQNYCVVTFAFAVVAQLVERQPSKLNVASSTLVRRSKKTIAAVVAQG